MINIWIYSIIFLIFCQNLCLTIDNIDEAINEANVQSNILKITPSTPINKKIHWHKIRHHSKYEHSDIDLSPEETFALERELFIKSAEIKPSNYDDIIGDLDMHPQLRDKQHYAPIESNRKHRIFNGYDEEEWPDYPPKLMDDLFGTAPIADTARCYSCMSKFYEAVWPMLKHVYKKPRNFTDRCNDEEFDAQSVPTTHCSTICVQMWEEPTVAGVKIRGYIRGCLDNILHNGFNETIVAWYRWLHRDSCHQYKKRDLFKLPIDQSDDSLVHVCTCYADHCNNSMNNYSNIYFITFFSLLLYRILLR